jgi:hypothetical protein
MEAEEERLTGRCGLVVWSMRAGLASTPVDPKLTPWTGAHGRYPDRICVAPCDHVARGLPHKWIRFLELLRN